MQWLGSWICRREGIQDNPQFMKILLITKTLAEFANIQEKVREIAKLGIQLTVVSPGRWGGKECELRRVKPDGYEFLVCKCWFSGASSIRLGNHLHFYPEISRVIEREKWDLVHIDEEPFNLATYHALTRCDRHRSPAIFTTWQNMMKRYPPPFNFFEKYVYKTAVGAIAGNGDALCALRRRGFGKPAAHIPQLGVDPAMFCKQDVTELRRKVGVDGTFVVGFVGRFSPEKGIDTLIEAMPLIPSDSTLVLVGAGPERPRLEALAEGLGVSARLRWVSWVDSSKIAEYMNAFDVLVLPSRTRWNVKEQFGRVLIEAMSCETPVIGSDSGEIPKVIGDAGMIFHEGNKYNLAEQLTQLIKGPAFSENLSCNGRKRVLEEFTYSKIAKDTVNFYKRICSEDK
jgi:glycosyltransferase involved in cell wall biosynthesis